MRHVKSYNSLRLHLGAVDLVGYDAVEAAALLFSEGVEYLEGNAD